MNKKVAIPFGITLAGVVLMIIMLFLPYASATSEYKEVLNQNKEGIFAQEIGMTNADMQKQSIVQEKVLKINTKIVRILKKIFMMICLMVLMIQFMRIYSKT